MSKGSIKKDDLAIITLIITLIITCVAVIYEWLSIIIRNNFIVPTKNHYELTEDSSLLIGTPGLSEYLYTFLFSITIPCVGPIILMIIGLYWLLSKYNRYYYYQEVFETKTDRRYKLKYKFTGNVYLEKKYVRIERDLRPQTDRKMLNKHYIAFVVFAVLSAFAQVYLYFYLQL